MKLETYLGLSDRERLEWHFVYEKKTTLRLSGLGSFVVIYSLVCVQILAVAVIWLVPGLEYLKGKSESMVYYAGQLARLGIIVFILDYVVQFAHYLFWKWKEKKWLDKRKKI